jgi:hypothetical protein
VVAAEAKEKCLVFVSTQCVDSGEIGSGPCSALFDSQDQAIACFSEQVAASRRFIESEIAKIADPANRLVFESPYTMQAALFAVPSDAANSAEDAIAWISEQLADDEDISDNVLQFEGTSFGLKGEKVVSLEDFLAQWP